MDLTRKLSPQGKVGGNGYKNPALNHTGSKQEVHISKKNIDAET